MKSALVRWGAVALMIGTLALAGCGGGGGGGGSEPAPAAGAGAGAPAGGGGGAAPVVAAPAGAAVPVGGLAAADFAALDLTIPAVSVSIASPPRVTFSLSNASGNKITGFGSTSRSATATVASYPNISFALAKLVPGTGTAPSRWVSYIVTSVPTTTTAATAQRPGTDNTGTLVDNGNGTYTYTFYRDITAVASQVAAMTLTGANNAADLDDLTYDPNQVHRLTIAISGNAPGTGTNTPTAVQTTPGVPMLNPVNAIYDFIPATGQQVPFARDIASTAKCNECHQNLGGTPDGTPTNQDARFHGGARNDVRYCVICHTDQRKYGRAEAVVLASGNYDGVSTYRINGLAVGNLPTHIHKIHMSSNLAKTGYYYGGILYEEACKMPQDIRNCTKCHDGTAGASNATAQGDNWKNVPSRKACGACHDGINFATGTGITLADAERVREGLPRQDFAGHVGGARADDSICALCHDAASIDRVYHLPVTSPNTTSALFVQGGSANSNSAWLASNTSRLPTGAIKVTYEIQSVSRNTSRQPVMVFRLLQNGVATRLIDRAANPTATEIWANFMGAPSVYFVYAVPQDGITAPADFNATASAYIRDLWNGGTTASCPGSRGTLTGPDASGFYTATVTTAFSSSCAQSAVTIPDSAVMLTGGVGYSYSMLATMPLTQTNLADYPVTPSAVTVATVSPAPSGQLIPGMPNKTGGLIVVAPNVQRVASAGAAAGGTGGAYTGRRAIVEDARCNKCHLELGIFTHESFHAGQRNDGTTCSWCHTPNRTSSGWSADSTSYIHAIHAAAKRTVPFNWHAASATDGFYTIKYPGILKNCETCHLPDTFDFRATASSNALPNRPYRTVATGTTAAATFTTSPYIAQTAGTVYGSGFSVSASGTITEAAGTTLVNSPIATACFACHDSALAQAHMRSNGGSLYAPRTTALATTEQCTLCHLPGRVADIRTMHAR